MKYIAPDYYEEFSCIKGACRHSCCIGWEIDIDEETLESYRSIGGTIGRRLAENIVCEDEFAHFRLGEFQRCPFLNRDGLCDLIIELGEDSLCQICSDHPRFRNFYSDREEIGLGLCCEAAAQLILGRGQPFQLEIIDDDGDTEELFEDEAELLALRDKLITILQNRNYSVKERIEHMLDWAQLGISEPDPIHWRDYLLSLERLDDNWSEMLQRLGSISASRHYSPEIETALEQLMVHLVYRHVNAECDDLSGRITFCALIWYLLRNMLGDGDFADLCEIARLYSSEIEYSDENIDAIIDEIRRQNPEI